MKIVLAASFAAASLALSQAIAGAADAPASPSPTLKAGDTAPAVTLKSVVDGKVEPYDLQAAVAKRPVVLYFFPKAFTAG
jgi:thioredoxin-dependent peroxiredoxin